MVETASHVSIAREEETVRAIVRAVVPRVHPELIVLFGSRADGTAREDSDFDLMVVFAEGAEAKALGFEAHRVLSDLNIAVDVLPRTVSVYRRQQHDPGFLDWLASREGRVLFATGTVPQRSPAPARAREESGWESVAMWIERAESDLQAAENSFAASTPSWDAICFHSHACVEKLLKALIVQTRETFPPRTHELAKLLPLQPDLARSSARIGQECTLLDALYPGSRYPELPMPSPGEARRAFEAAREAHRVLRPMLDR